MLTKKQQNVINLRNFVFLHLDIQKIVIAACFLLNKSARLAILQLNKQLATKPEICS